MNLGILNPKCVVCVGVFTVLETDMCKHIKPIVLAFTVRKVIDRPILKNI